jgi:aspartate kinase
MSGERAPIVVMKFGGTSVGDVSRIQHVADIVAEHRRRLPDVGVIVVLSAMAGETNKLVALAKSCVERPNPREMDVLLASGEQITIALLAMRLIEAGVPAKSLLAQQAQIATNSEHTNALIESIDAEQLSKLVAQGVVPVVAGFQGVDEQGDITTLGRGGSDITAVAIAAAVRAQTCFIYTDVAGVFSTDPRMCKNAKLIERVCHEEMLEMASLGAKVLHTRSVYFAMRYEVPLVVLSTFEGPFIPGKNGTWIVAEEKLMEKPIVTGVTYRTDEACIVVEGMSSDIGKMSRLFSELSRKNIFIDMISQESVDSGSVNLSLTVPDESSLIALETMQTLVPELGASGVKIDRDIAKVSVVGIGMRYHTGVAARVFEALARERIGVTMINTSEIKMSVLVPRKYCEVAVRVLHDEFTDFQVTTAEER